jgi:predicted MFS family arabinose efflux permease
MQILYSPQYRRLWCSTLASAGAQNMERVATGWLALETGGGPLGVGIVFAARLLPSLLFGLLAGTLADRFDRRRILVAVALGAAALTTTLGVLVGAGAVTLWSVAAIAFLNGCIMVYDSPSRQSLIFDLVGREHTPNAIALNAVASRLFAGVGAFIGGLAIPLVGVANTYFLVTAAYLVGLILVFGLKVPLTQVSHLVRPAFRVALGGAARLIVNQPLVRTLMIAAMACEIFAFSYMSLVPTIARDVLQVGAEGLGVLTGAASIGATVAVIFLSWLPGRVRREPLLTAVYVSYGVGLLALAVAPSLSIATIIMLVVGASSAAFDALQQTMIQLVVPEDQRGSAVGIWVFSIGTGPVGYIEVGVLASAVGAPTTLLFNGACTIFSAAVLLARSPAFRPRRAAARLGTLTETDLEGS